MKFYIQYFFRKYVVKIQVPLQSDNKSGYFTWRPLYIVIICREFAKQLWMGRAKRLWRVSSDFILTIPTFDTTGDVSITLLSLQPLFQGRINNYHIFWVCVCSLRYPACSAHASYCYVWSTLIDIIFSPDYLTNGTIFEKMLLNIKCVFWFSLQFLSETFLISRRTERDMIKNVYWCSCEVL
jgi:hypothetical protein